MRQDMVLSVKNLNVQYYGSKNGVYNVGLQIKRGRVLGLLGESGSGKSTICNAALGLLDPTAHISGSVFLQGKELLELSEDERNHINGKDIGTVMQNPMVAFDPCMKIKGHFVETLCTHLHCSKRDAILHGIDLLKEVGLKNEKKIMNSFPSRLSGGMLQRVMIALAISLNPSFIIADEPTTALDRMNQKIVLELFSQIMEEYRPAMLLVSHDMEVLNALADDIAVIKDGKILEQGTLTEIMNHPKDSYTKELLASASYMGVLDCLQ